ncbi:MAG: alpha-2-macroglobulin family protein [Gemmataceae bacterium]
MASQHDHVAPLVDDFVHDLLPPDDAARVERHCRSCRACAAALDRARRRLALLQAMAPTEAPSSLVRNTLDRIDEAQSAGPGRRRLGFGVLAALAASALVLAGAHLHYANLKPGTIDLVLLGQRELLAATTASLRVRLVDQQANAALAGVPVVVTLRGHDGPSQLAAFTTDEQGTGSPQLELPDWPDGTYRLEVSARTPAGPETLTREVKLKRSAKLLLSSDKPVYQPGQKVLLRSLALRRPDLKPVGGKTAVFTLTDPRGNVLFKHSQPTSPFGIASAECELAQEIQEGTYTVACNVEGTESRLSVEVRRYVLPKFKLALRPDRPYYAPGAKAAIGVQADYFFGKPVTDGRLDFEVVSKAGQMVASGNTKTTAEGTAKLDVLLPTSLAGRLDDNGDARLTLTALLTDSAGQKQVASTELLVTSQPVRVQTLPEAGQLVQGVPNNVFVLVSRADGEPVKNVKVSVAGDGVEAETTTDARGVGSFQFTPLGAEVTWTVRVTDAGGEVLARRAERVAVGQAHGDFLVRLDQAVYQAGQTMTLTALGGGVEPVFVDLIKDGQTMLSRTVEMKGGQGELTFDIPQELFGTVQLVAYRFLSPHGLPVRKARVVYIAPPNGLRVNATLDQGEYRPGKEATLNLRLFDDKGRPAPGAVSLAAVDEAVFAVLTQKPGTEKTFYNLEQELLQPVYAAYGSWRPEDNVEVALRDRALFTRTVRGLDRPPSGWAREAPSPQLAEAGPHTLAVRSLPIKEQQTQSLQRQRLDQVRRGWVLLVLMSLLCGYVALWTCVPALDMLKMHAIGLVGLLFIAAFAFVFLGTSAKRSFEAGAKMADAAPTAMAERPLPMAAEDGPPDSRRSGPTLPRVRREFPETLLWKPELITDDEGQLPPVKIALADSITTWRLSASAVSADGRLGAASLPIKVFQPFFVDLNLPVSLTRGDEVGVPAVVYNYLDKPQTVTLTLAEGAWFTLDGQSVQKVHLAAGEVRSTRFTLKTRQAGQHTLKVTAQAGDVGDAIERVVEVIPDGKRVEFNFSGSLGSPAEHTLAVPAEAVEGSVKAVVKVYPGGFSQLVEGLENIFRMPSGCFEQTSSTTYPNVLALDYIRRHNLQAPDVEAKARQYIHLGYQRLVSFEVPGGGFDWFGRPPANRTLTAYGLMEFQDMAKVHDVDPRLIDRTRQWLLSKRKPDGSWPAERGMLNDGLAGNVQRGDLDLGTTAYIAWAVGGQADMARTLDWLLAHRPDEIKDPHTLALVCNALLAIDPEGQELPAYLDRLAGMAGKSDDGRHHFWGQEPGGRTLFHAAGVSGQVETTALAALALLEAKRHPAVTHGALAWLVAKKDAHGTWHSTQATVLALKALLAGTGAGGEAKERRFVLSVGRHTEEVTIPADQSEVLKLIDVTKHLAAGETRLSLTEKSSTAAGYQVVFRYHVPGSKTEAKPGPLAITIDYDRTLLSVGGAVKAKATVENKQGTAAPMVMLDLPVPPGFAADSAEWQALVADGTIARFQVLPRSVLVYLRGLEPGRKLELAYTLRATMPVSVAAPGGRVYEYYDPQRQGSSPPARFVVKPAG